MALIGFKSTHNQDIYINPAQVLYLMPFEEGVTIIAFAASGSSGQPHSVYVRGNVDQVRKKFSA